jgi:hypothetical protein
LGIPTNSGTQSDPNPNTLEWGLALEYSLIYLQELLRKPTKNPAELVSMRKQAKLLAKP